MCSFKEAVAALEAQVLTSLMNYLRYLGFIAFI